jgi:elongation factor G
VQQLKDKLECDAVLMQYPIGKEHDFEGMVDLITMEAMYFDGEKGDKRRNEAIPAGILDECKTARQAMLEALSMYSDELMELLLAEEEPSVALIHSIVRDAVRQQDLTPVFLGTAYKNKGVQPLLDAIIEYLPSPLDREIKAKQVKDETQAVALAPDAAKPFVGMAFKIVDDPYGQLTFTRIYQGTIKKGESYHNQRTGRKERFSRIVRLHADDREEIDSASAGDIVAIMGIDAASGDTYATDRDYCTLESMFVPQPVIKVAVNPASRADADKLGKALARFRKEDPTFQVMTDEETGETIMAGMGELHLEIYVERIKREYKVEVEVGAPKVSYREAPQQAAEYNYKHKKQTGGSGQYAHIVGRFEPLGEDETENFIFEDEVVGGRVPKEYIPSVEKGFKDSLGKGPVAGFPIVGIRCVLTDGSYHDVDSSDMAFQICARSAFRETFLKMKPALLEPIMKLEIEFPTNFQGQVTGDVVSRRGIVMGTEQNGNTTVMIAEVPLAELFGYSTDLRSQTQGQGTFSMEFAKYRKVPGNIQEDVIAEVKQRELVGAR